MEKKSQYAIKSILSIVLFTIAFAIWAFSFSIISEVKAIGFAVTEVKRQIISHKDGGVLQALYIKEGDLVEEGQELMSIKNLLVIEEYDKVTDAIKYLRVKIARLESEINNKSFEFKTDFDKNYFQQELLVHENNLNILSDKINVLNNQKKQHLDKINNLKIEQELLNQEVLLVERKWDTAKRLEKVGAGSKNKSLISEIELGRSRNRLHEVQATIDQVIGVKNELESKIEYEKSLTMQGMLAEIELSKIEYKKKKVELISIRQRYERQVVSATLRGTIHRVFIDTIGSAIRSNQEIIEIIPKDKKLIVEANLDLDKRDQIWLGMNARIIPPNSSLALFDPIIGEVYNISADSFLDQVSNSSYFKIKIIIGENNNADIFSLLHKGMQVSVRFETGEHTIAEYLGRPFLRGVRDILREPLL